MLGENALEVVAKTACRATRATEVSGVEAGHLQQEIVKEKKQNKLRKRKKKPGTQSKKNA